MTDPTQNLSEISHLFLSGVRDMAGHGAPRPMRIPPPKQNVSIDMTPEEWAAAQRGDSVSPSAAKDSRRIGPVSAVLASHFGDALHDQVKSYARHLANAHNQRVGIIELDASLFRLYTVEKSLGSSAGESSEPAPFEAHQLAEALEEMNWDIDRWLILVPNPRLPEARALLRSVANWTLLTTGDHEGMVSAYRSLKSLNESHRPRLSLAVLDADRSEAERIHHKLTGVCAQFLNWPVAEDFTHVATPPANIEAHAVLAWQPTHDKAAAAANHHWKITTDFLQKASAHVVDDTPALTEAEAAFVEQSPEQPAAPSPTVPWPARPAVSSPSSGGPGSVRASSDFSPSPGTPGEGRGEGTPPQLGTGNWELGTSFPIPQSASRNPQSDEVLDLPNNDPTQILPTLLSHSTGQLVECPLRPPHCPEARLAISRDRRIVLLAVARQGLSDLRTIGQAYRWLIENRPLISMAVPQLAIDPHQHPELRLIVNHADLTADLLQPMLHSSSVTVQSYRTLRWGPKTGLLLEAA